MLCKFLGMQDKSLEEKSIPETRTKQAKRRKGQDRKRFPPFSGLERLLQEVVEVEIQNRHNLNQNHNPVFHYHSSYIPLFVDDSVPNNARCL